jgi:hypothetical protein
LTRRTRALLSSVYAQAHDRRGQHRRLQSTLQLEFEASQLSAIFATIILNELKPLNSTLDRQL